MSVTYGTLTLLDSSPTGGFTEPLTVSEVRKYLGLPERSPDDADETALLEGLIAGARAQAEQLQGRDLVRKHYELRHDAFWLTEIPLRAPLVAVTSVAYKDSDGTTTTLTENTDYIVDTSKQPGFICPVYGGSWPTFTAWPTSAVTIRFTSGYLDTDKFWIDAGRQIKTGMKLLISEWYNNRLPFEIGASAVQEYPYAVTALLSAGALLRAI